MAELHNQKIIKKKKIKSAIDPPVAIDEEKAAREAIGLPGNAEQKAVIKPHAADLGNVTRVVPGTEDGPFLLEPINPIIPGQLLDYFIRGGWTEPKDTPYTHNTSHGPALAAFKGKLYMAYKGSNTDLRIWYSIYDGNKWLEKPIDLCNEQHKDFQTSCAPALAAFGSRLYLVWKGSGTDTNIWFSRSADGLTWDNPKTTGGKSTHEPALALFKDKLFMAWKSSTNSTVLYAFLGLDSNGNPQSEWTHKGDLGEHAVNTSCGPSLAASEQKLYLAWKGMNNDNRIWYASMSMYLNPLGTNYLCVWTPHGNAISDNKDLSTSCGPALATFAKYWEHAKGYDPIHKDLYMVWKGSGSDNLIQQSTYRLNELEEKWTPQVSISSRVQTSDTPALAEFQNTLFMAWKDANEAWIHFSHLNIGSDNHIRNIFEKSRPGIPVVRPEDLAVFRIETRNMTVVNEVTIGINPNYNTPGFQTIKEKENVKVVLLSSLAEIKTPSRLETLATVKETAKLKEAADKLKEAGVEVVFCSSNINEDTITFFAKEGITVLHNVTQAEMNELALVTGATVNNSIEDWTAARIVGTVGRFEVAQPGGGLHTFIPTVLKPRLKRNSPTGDAYLILHFPPQSFAEQTFFQENTSDIKDEPVKDVDKDKPISNTGTGSELCDPPIRARIAHESRLVFMVPNNFPDIEYTLEGILEACRKLELKVSTSKEPELPASTTTSIEMPWRLILSPNSGAYWRHTTSLPVSSDSTKPTELWHTQMVTPHDGEEIMSPYPDEKRTTRAIWALSGIGNEIAKTDNGKLAPMQREWPASSNLPSTDSNPFRTSLDNFDRYQIAHLSSNFTNKYVPVPLNTNMLMLSSLGGWLDSCGNWDPSGVGFSVEQWVNRATMGRDHYVRVVYRGFLFPFGHRVSLIKVSERKFNKTVSGNYAAYLHQRLYMVVGEKERIFTDCDALFQQTTTIIDNELHYLARKFPFRSVKLLTEITPDLDDPDNDFCKIKDNAQGRKMFWPHVNKKAFSFQCTATDLEGRRILFDLPMIFVDSTLATPRGTDGSLAFEDAEAQAKFAMSDYESHGLPLYNTTNLKMQRVALAKSLKPGDTSVQVDQLTFGGFAQQENQSLRTFSKDLTRPLWVPQVEQITAKIDSITHLSGAQGTHSLKFNMEYQKYDLGKDGNKGEVFVDINGGPNLDFSSQGDKSGGFIQPNLTPAALSRLAGPVMGDETQLKSFITGTMSAGAGFPNPNPNDVSGLPTGLPMPLLFGCIPLGALIKPADVAGKGVPKFISEAGSKFDSFFNDLGRLSDLTNNIPAQGLNIVKAAFTAFNDTLLDLIDQAKAYDQTQVAPLITAIKQMTDNYPAINSLSNWSNLIIQLNNIGYTNAVNALKNVGNNLPGNVSAGFKQSVRNTADKLGLLLNQIEQLQTLLNLNTGMCEILNNIVSNPLDTNNLNALNGQLEPFINALNKADLLDGAPLNTMLTSLKAVKEILTDIPNLVKMLTDEELTVRFDWNPEISNWGLEGGSASTDPLFRANDKKGLLVSVEAKVKKNGKSSPKISVNCSLKHFDLVLIAPASFIELNFEKIEFTVDSAAKMDVDVKLSDIKFVGVLSFVETLRDLIPLNGFSDPPYLDITSKGIDAGYSISLPSIGCGILNICNLSLAAGFTVPFIGEPVSVRFNFCRREQPFTLTVMGLGGGGFFGITIDPHGVQILEASLEFGAALAVNFGVAFGEVHIMAGIYFRMEKSEASLTGYFRLGGSVRVLGLITASIELYLSLTYEFSSGKCVGMAQLTIEISLLFFKASATIKCERKLAGSNGDPTFRQMYGPVLEDNSNPTLSEELNVITDATQYGWRDYVEAFTYEETIL